MSEDITTPAPAEEAPAAPKPEGAPRDAKPRAAGAPTGDEDRRGGHSKGGRGKRRRKVSYLTLNKIEAVNYKDVGLLRRFINEQGKILSARQTGNTAGQQRMVTRAIRRAREMALLPFVSLEIAAAERPFRDRGEGRPIRRDRPRPEGGPPPRPEGNAPEAQPGTTQA